MREWKKREGSGGDAHYKHRKEKGKGIQGNGGKEKEVDVVDGRK